MSPVKTACCQGMMRPQKPPMVEDTAAVSQTGAGALSALWCPPGAWPEVGTVRFQLC